MSKAIEVVRQQRWDEGLWFKPKLMTEDYLQRALGDLHNAVEQDYSERIKDET